MKQVTKEKILEILNDCLIAEENFFMGQPACPSISGKDEAAIKILELFNNVNNFVNKK